MKQTCDVKTKCNINPSSISMLQLFCSSNINMQCPWMTATLKTTTIKWAPYEWIWHFLIIASRVHQSVDTRLKNVLLGSQTWLVLPPNIWSLTAVTGNWHTKGKLCIFFRSAHSAHIPFFSTFRHISCSETAHLPPEIIINVYKFLQRIFCWAKTNQVDNSRLLQTSNVWRQNMSCFFLTCTRLDATDSNKNN